MLQVVQYGGFHFFKNSVGEKPLSAGTRTRQPFFANAGATPFQVLGLSGQPCKRMTQRFPVGFKSS